MLTIFVPQRLSALPCFVTDRTGLDPVRRSLRNVEYLDVQLFRTTLIKRVNKC